MSIVPLIGHEALQERIREARRRGALPSSILLEGPPGIGKQRLGLWVGQMLLCSGHDPRPCGGCQHCRFTLTLSHPDLHWYFPQPRQRDSDPDLDDVKRAFAEVVAERAADAGLYEPSSGSDGIYVATVRAIVQQAVMSPAIASAKVFVIGDAERMVPQEGSEQAANAFLKLLEEPPADTHIILTSSEAGALLPTIRSRVVTIRVPRLRDDEVAQFLALEEVGKRLAKDSSVPRAVADRVQAAQGAPGRLVAGADRRQATDAAREMLDSVTGRASAVYDVAWGQASSRARGAFADTLDALTTELHQRALSAANRGDARQVRGAARAIEAVEDAKERTASNISPQLITVRLLRDLRERLA